MMIKYFIKFHEKLHNNQQIAYLISITTTGAVNTSFLKRGKSRVRAPDWVLGRPAAPKTTK